MINVSDELKNAVINEEMPKYLNIYGDSSWDRFRFNMLTNQRIVGSRGTEGDTDIQNLTFSLTHIFDLSNINYDLIIGEERSVTVSLRVNFHDYQLRRKSDGVWVTNVQPTTFKLRVYGKFNGTIGEVFTGSTNQFSSYYDKPFNSIYFCNAILNSSPRVKIEELEITSVDMTVYFDSTTYDGCIVGLSVYDPRVTVSDTSGATTSPDLTATPYNLEQYLDSGITTVSNENIIGEAFDFEESVCSASTLKLGGCETNVIHISTFDDSNDYLDKATRVRLRFNDKGNFFFYQMIVKRIEKKARGYSIVKNLTAQNILYRLNENAYSWYSQYMWGMNLLHESTERPYNFDYQRQIFSTYWNLANKYGIERISRLNFSARETFLEYDECNSWSNDYKFDNSFMDKETTSEIKVYCDFFYVNSTTLSDYKAIKVHYTAFYNIGDWYKEQFDSLERGIKSLGSIMIDVYDSNNNLMNSFLCDNDDLLLLPEGYSTLKIIIPTYYGRDGESKSRICEGIAIYGVKFSYYDPYTIVNATQPLPYYSYVWQKPTIKNIFTVDSSVTARDVMRSLMEMCGCFYRIGRDGKPQFIYAQEHGLYPSNDLYPADTLFPKKSGEMTMPTSYYISAEFAEYQVEKFGGVQVVVRTKDNTGAVVRWEYWEDESSDSAYLIDDNIFLCAEEFLYDPQNTSNIDTLLENIFHCLDNLQYTPFTAETIGTPFLESGDRFTLLTQTDGFESFIFDRKLKGIQALKDHYEARGVAKTPRVKNFEWQS